MAAKTDAATAARTLPMLRHDAKQAEAAEAERQAKIARAAATEATLAWKDATAAWRRMRVIRVVPMRCWRGRHRD